jgi:hypothetical protein
MFTQSMKRELVTEEEIETYQKEIEEAKKKVVYPDNPCLFTPGIRIYNHNLKIAALKQKYLKQELQKQNVKLP